MEIRQAPTSKYSYTANRKYKPRGRWRAPVIFLVVCAIAVLVGIGGGMGLYKMVGDWGVSVARNRVHLNPPPFGGKPAANILLMGIDKRANDVGRSDTMIVMHIDAGTKQIRLLSVPRDTRVTLPGENHYAKINAALPTGGVEMTMQAVADLLGITIDYYAVTDFDGFKEAVDKLGGVTIDVEKEMNYDDRRGHLHIHLKPGSQHLNGEEAIGYVRFRHDAEGDITRMKRQQKFLRAIAHEMARAKNMFNAPAAFSSLRDHIDTDLPPDDIAWLVRTAKNISDEKIQGFSVPTESAMIHGGSYQITDETKLQPIIEYVFYGAAESTLEAPVIEVYNATGKTGAAKDAADRLKKVGFEVRRVETWDKGPVDQTRLIDNHSRPAAAQSVAQLFALKSVSTEVDETKKADLTLILGADFLRQPAEQKG